MKASDGERGPRAGEDPARAVSALLERHGGTIHALAARLCGNRADAEDMVQDVFLQALRKWSTFRGESDAGTWLYSIAARSCKARMRRKGGVDRRAPAVSQLMPWGERTVTAVGAARDEDENGAERAEAVERVRGAVARLPEHLRVPLVLKDIVQMRGEDVAAALGLSENTVKTRVHRARLALRKAMTAKAASVAAPAPVFEKQVCLDLLKAKMDAMDRGGVAAGQGVPQAEVCARCRAVFRELDIVQEACGDLASGALPERVRGAIVRAIAERDALERPAGGRARRGRRPVARSRRR